MKILLFLARRFIFNTRDRTLKIMLVVTCLSIGVGACALALVAAVMKGYEHETRAVVQSVHPSLIIDSGGKKLNYPALKTFIEKHFGSSIKAITPYAREYGLAQPAHLDRSHNMSVSGLNKTQEMGTFVVMTGIDPITEPLVASLSTKIIAPSNKLANNSNANDVHVSKKFSELFLDKHVLIGSTLASNLSVNVGDAITLFFNAGSPDDIILEKHRVTVGGIFKTGVSEIDSHVVYGDLELLRSMVGSSFVSQVGLSLDRTISAREEKRLINELENRIKLQVFSWQDLYPALLSALTLEKYTMIFILILIMLVAVMNIISLLFMYISHKKTEIGLLKTLGLTNHQLYILFIIMGMGIALAASALGILCAIIISYLLEHYHLIKLPDVYYISHLPAHMDYSIVVAVFVLVFIVSLLACLLPARSIARIHAASLLKSV